MTLRFTILGCGASPGVPRIDGAWGACDPANPKNRRTRCSMLVERFAGSQRTAILIDTGPDMREQLIPTGVAWLDGVFYTHDHADHTHGIDDLRILAYRGGKKIDVYFDQATGDIVQRRFDYCFVTPEGSSYPPIVKAHVVEHGREVVIKGAGGEIRVLPFRQLHGDIDSVGYRIGGLAYSSDLHTVPDESMTLIEGLDIWVVDALRHIPHPSHFSVEQALEWIAKVGPRRSILTHLNFDLDYDALRQQLPDGIEPAYDGMQFELPG